MAAPTWAMVSVLLADAIEKNGEAEIDMSGHPSRMRQYIRRKVITKWYNRNRIKPFDLHSETKNNVVYWWVKPTQYG
jgi:hypothetical protein